MLVHYHYYLCIIIIYDGLKIPCLLLHYLTIAVITVVAVFSLGFPVDAEDERGNTLLLVAAQNSNKRLVEMLLVRGAAINHQNAQGNTALHFAIAFDSEGKVAEYLIEHGADDTIQNVEGMTAYDGVAT